MVENVARGMMGGADNSGEMNMNNIAAKVATDYAFGKLRDKVEENKGYLSFLNVDGLKVYFDVTNSYVLHKLKVIILPFLVSSDDWIKGFHDMHGGAAAADPTDGISFGNDDKKHRPSQNLLAYDLYIPLMAFVNYIIIAGFYHGANKDFTSDKLSYLYSKLMFFWIFNAIIIKGVFMFQQFGDATGVPFLDTLSLCGYQFVILCFITSAQLLAGTAISYGVLGVFGAIYCLFFYFTCKQYTSRHRVMDEATRAGEGGFFNPKQMVAVILCGLQFALLWYLSYN